MFLTHYLKVTLRYLQVFLWGKLCVFKYIICMDAWQYILAYIGFTYITSKLSFIKKT